MKSEPTWRDLAIGCIAESLIEYAQTFPGDIDPQKCRRWVSLHRYPFMERRGFRYTVWCSECIKIPSFFKAHSDVTVYPGWRNGLSLSRTSKSFKEMAEAAESIGQINMFDRSPTG